MFEIKPIYKTVEITKSYSFSDPVEMNLNEVLLRILDDTYIFYGSIVPLGYDIVWIKLDMVSKWENINKVPIREILV